MCSSCFHRLDYVLASWEESTCKYLQPLCWVREGQNAATSRRSWELLHRMLSLPPRVARFDWFTRRDTRPVDIGHHHLLVGVVKRDNLGGTCRSGHGDALPQKGNFADLNKKQMSVLIGHHPVLGITFSCVYCVLAWLEVTKLQMHSAGVGTGN